MCVCVQCRVGWIFSPASTDCLIAQHSPHSSLTLITFPLHPHPLLSHSLPTSLTLPHLTYTHHSPTPHPNPSLFCTYPYPSLSHSSPTHLTHTHHSHSSPTHLTYTHHSPTPHPNPSLFCTSPTPITLPLFTHTPHRYLDTAQCCDNPKCVGVYFETSVQAVKFSDFCGKYRIPFQHYLCSNDCSADLSSPSPSPSPLSSSGEQDETDSVARLRMQKVLLG